MPLGFYAVEILIFCLNTGMACRQLVARVLCGPIQSNKSQSKSVAFSIAFPKFILKILINQR